MNSLETLLLSLLIIVLILYFIKLYYLSCSEPFTTIPNSEPNLYLPQNFRPNTYLTQQKEEINSQLTISNYYETPFIFKIKYIFYKTSNLQNTISVFYPKLKTYDITNFLLYYSILFNNWENFFYLLDTINLLIFNKNFMPSTHTKFINEFKTENKEALNFYNSLIDSFYETKNKIQSANIFQLMYFEKSTFSDKDLNNFIIKYKTLAKKDKNYSLFLNINKKNIQPEYLPFILEYEKVNDALDTIVESLPKNLNPSSLNSLMKRPSNLFINSQTEKFLKSLNKVDIFRYNEKIKQKFENYMFLAFNVKMKK